MLREDSNGRVKLCVPSVFVVPPIPPPQPPPVPGTVTFESIRPPLDPPNPFLLPWDSFRNESVVMDQRSLSCLPCEIDSDALQRHNIRHDVRKTVEAVFKDYSAHVIEDVMKSLDRPFSPGEGQQIAWSVVGSIKRNPGMNSILGGKKLVHRHKILTGAPWSIASFADDADSGKCVVRRNVVYDGEGNAVAQVDFGHGKTCGIHCHALVQGNLEHTAAWSDDHMFPLRSVPWVWLCIPDVRTLRLIQAQIDGLSDEDQPEDEEKLGSNLFGLCDTLAIDDTAWSCVALPYDSFFV